MESNPKTMDTATKYLCARMPISFTCSSNNKKSYLNEPDIRKNVYKRQKNAGHVIGALLIVYK